MVSTAQLALTEASQRTFTISLSERPASAVTVRTVSSNGAKVAAAPMTLVIEPGDYATPHTITVTAREDDDVADEQHSVLVEAMGMASAAVQVSISDNDGLGLVVSPGGTLEITEGTNEMLSISLSAQPSVPVTATLTSNNPLAATLSPATLVFTPENWQTAQQVTLSAPDDGDSTNEQGGIELGGDGIADIAVPVTAFDDDLLGIAPTSTNLGTMTEGTRRPITIRLMQAPSTTILVGVAPSEAAVLSVAPNTLTFTPANWSTPQTVQVESLQDIDTIGRNTSLTLTASGLMARTVVAAIVDDDVQALVTSTNQLNVPEEATATLDVSLAFQPEGDVIIDASSLAPTIATVAPPRLTFTRDNYAAPQRLTVSASNDLDAVPGSATLRLEQAMTGMAKNVELRIAENDVMGLATNAASLSLAENGSATIGVKLTALPLTPVTVTLLSTDTTAAGVEPASLTFTSADWDTFKTVMVSGREDDDLAIESLHLRMAMAGPIEKLTPVTVVDNDVQVLELGRSSMTVTEGPAGGTFTVRLGFQPADNLTVNAVSNNTAVASVQGSPLTFTPSNYRTPQPITVVGEQDMNLVTNQATIIVTTGTTVASVAVSVSDDDFQAVVLSTGSLTIDEGFSTSFGVTLRFQPTDNAVVFLAAANTSIATIDRPSLTFTPSNYFTPQSVSVRGVPDANNSPDSTTVNATSHDATSASLQINVLDLFCGDGSCSGGENAGNCPADCPASCGDSFCSHTENAASCPNDCPTWCGDGFCTGNEAPENCPVDCGPPPRCGDEICDGGEEFTCPTDCDSCIPRPPHEFCPIQ